MAITKITSNVLATNTAQDNLNAGSVIVFTKPLSATNTNIIGKVGILDTTSAVGSGLSGSALNIAQTWNTNLTPTALSVNVTDLSSNAASLLMDLRVGGESKLKFKKGGGIFSRAAK